MNPQAPPMMPSVPPTAPPVAPPMQQPAAQAPNVNLTERVYITNKETGEVRGVTRGELPTYGLPVDYQPQGQIAAQRAMQTNDTSVINALPDTQRASAMQYLNDKKFVPPTKAQLATKQKEADHQASLDETKKNAQAVLDVLDMGKQGKLTGQQYKDALNYAVGNYSSSKAFAAGGKNLTANELAQLAGTMPVIRQHGPNVIDKITGNIPPQTGEVVDDENTIRNKMLLALGKKGQYPAKPTGPSLGGAAQNAANDLSGMASGIAQVAPYSLMGPGLIPSLMMNQSMLGEDMSKWPQNAGAMGQQALQDLGATVGVSKDQNGLHFDPATAANHAYNHPVDTAATLSPLLELGKLGEIGKLGKGAEAAKTLAPLDAATAARTTLPGIPQVGGALKGTAEGVSELVTGGGPKDLIARNVNLDGSEPLSRTLLKHGIDGALTGKGKIVKTQQALTDTGSQLQKTFDRSPVHLDAGKLSDQVKTELTKRYGASQEGTINDIVQQMAQEGNFDLGKGSQTLSMTDLWKLRQGMDKYGMRALSIPTSGPLMKQMAKDVSGILREQLAKHVPEATPSLREYGNLRSYMDDVLQDPGGVKVKGGVLNTMSNHVGTGINAGAQGVYNLGKKLSK